MYPRIVKVTIALPWNPPQVILVRELLRGVYMLQIKDRYGRMITMFGKELGFGIKLFKSTRNHSYLIVKNIWDEVLYASESDAEPSPIAILDIEANDC